MADSLYYISIKRHDGGDVKLRPGGHGERDLLQALADKLSWATSRAKAVQALEDVLKEQKFEVLP